MDSAKHLLGKRVRYLRRAKNLTQARLAEKVNMSVNYISQIETGVASPTFEAIFAIANGLEVSLHELFDFAAIQPNE